MSLRRPLVLVLSLVGLAGLGGYAWYANRMAASPVEAAVGGVPSGSKAPAVPVAVEVQPVRTVSMPDDVTAVGTLVSNESVILRPEVAGRVAAIRFAEGETVSKGAVLVEFDAAVQRAEVQQARANLKLAESNHRRTEDLFARKFVSQSSRDTALSQLEVARAAVALAEARFERTRIRAPFGGVVGIRRVSVGDYIKEGETLINLEEIATLKVDFRLPEQYLGRIGVGQALEVTSDVLAGEAFSARVHAIDPLVDTQGRAVAMRAKLANEGARLRPGMFVRVRLILQERAAVKVVTEEAVVPAAGELRFVYRVEDEVAKRVDVVTGVRRDSLVEIVDGLAPGDLVVTAGQLKLRDGARVRVVASQTAEATR